MDAFESRIKARLYEVWDLWKPDYDGWLAWSDASYAPDATIKAIGDEPQRFTDYQQAMKVYRDAFDMEMGPIETFVVQGDTTAHSYTMRMTQKAEIMGIPATGRTVVIPTTEFNTFAEVPGFDEPMIVRLELLSAGLLEQLVTVGEDGRLALPA